MPTSCTWKVPFSGKFYPYESNLRIVPPFSVQTLQAATTVPVPPKCHSTKQRVPIGTTTFRRYYYKNI